MKEMQRSCSYYCQDNITYKNCKDNYFGSSSFVRSVDITQTTLFLKDIEHVFQILVLKFYLSCS